ncbi:MAG: cytochrome-c peroxidase [Yoonia sp.]|nr:cytochrome-c peroxidase [Yoonia sp.]
MEKRLMRSTLFVLGLLVSTEAASQTLPQPLQDDSFNVTNLDEAKLGQLLFYDPILSGNRNIACATCHHPRLGTADGLALGIGEGGIGLGPDRRIDMHNPPKERIPRNAPALFNLGAKEFTAMFHDGRLEIDESRKDGVRTPMGDDMVAGFASLLSAQTMFPVLSRDEMAGGYRENDVGRAVRRGLIAGDNGAWNLLAQRVAGIPQYARQFTAVYPDIDGPDDIAFTDVSNAIAVFMAQEWRADQSPFDAVLRGETVLTGLAADGQQLFYGGAGCADCHSGALQTDHQFHAMGAPQIGPGKAASFEDHQRDEGRFRVTGNTADLYAFRTPSLRNVQWTAPYGHAGAHRDLASFIRDHVDPVAGLKRFERSQVDLLDPTDSDFAVMEDTAQVAAIGAAVKRDPVPLSANEVEALVAFLNSLTDTASLAGRLGIPESVPSGLPVP